MNSAVNLNNNILNKTSKEQISLDAFCDLHGLVPDVLKIDIEGYELHALEGAKNVLKQYKPIIILSYHPKHLKRLSITNDQFISFIDENNYAIYDVDGNKTTDLTFNEYILKPTKNDE